jgi:uncharacterized protein
VGKYAADGASMITPSLPDGILDKKLEMWDSVFREKAKDLYPAEDPAHDFLHVCRVVGNAIRLAKIEGANLNIVLPAGYFHDYVNLAKDNPERKHASSMSAIAALEYLSTVHYPDEFFRGIKHAIEAHSFSAEIKPETIEAKVVQDADRLDALGAIGIARCFSTSTRLRTPYYCSTDPWAVGRQIDDKQYAIDHFPAKLFQVAATMQTKAAQIEAKNRVLFMKNYLVQMQHEI